MTGLGKRLATLEARAPVGRPACRCWSRVVYEDEAGHRTRPDRCPDCGRHMPVLLVRMVYGVPLEAV